MQPARGAHQQLSDHILRFSVYSFRMDFLEWRTGVLGHRSANWRFFLVGLSIVMMFLFYLIFIFTSFLLLLLFNIPACLRRLAKSNGDKAGGRGLIVANFPPALNDSKSKAVSWLMGSRES